MFLGGALLEAGKDDEIGGKAVSVGSLSDGMVSNGGPVSSTAR
jgi:hypothetical protein